MPEVSATLSNYRQSPRKVRRVANVVRGKKVSSVLIDLSFLTKRAGGPIKKLIESAVANAKNLNLESDDLYLTKIEVNKGVTLKRSMPRARGRSAPIHKHSSHIRVILNTENPHPSKKEKKAKQSAVETK